MQVNIVKGADCAYDGPHFDAPTKAEKIILTFIHPFLLAEISGASP